MTVEDLKKEVIALTAEEREEITAFLYHLRHAGDPEYQRFIEARLDDKDPSHWLTVDEFERKLDGR